jgi:SNF2 family DNA or RNA helicase
MENFNDIPMVQQPLNLKVNLFQHQLASVYMMEDLECCHYIIDNCGKTFTDIAINGDMTGYGKTLSIIALILRDRMEWDLEVPLLQEIVTPYASHHIKNYVSRSYPKNNTTLIIAGLSVIHQWMKEFSHTDLAVFAATSRKDAMNVIADEYDVIIVSPATYNIVVKRYTGVAWKRFIYDEPTTLRIPSMQHIIAGFIWFLTATPNGIIDKHKSCRKSYMNIIVGDRNFNKLIKTLTVKNHDDFVKMSFTMPPTNHRYYDCYVPTFRAVNGLVGGKISNMIEAGNISGAIEALGGKRTDNIIELVKKNKEIQLSHIKEKITYWTLNSDLDKIGEWKTREKVVIQQLEELDKRFGKILDENCSICFSTIDNPVMEPSCQNIFCGACLLNWLKTNGTCPLCRTNINKCDLIYINKNNFLEVKEESKHITKEDTIITLVRNNNSGRFIVFSDWDESFTSIREVMKTNNIQFVEVKGTINTRTRNIEKFRNGQVNVVFLNSKTDSSGINMQETTDIILYHAMNEVTTKQIIGRANRIGRKTPLEVHHLVSI